MAACCTLVAPCRWIFGVRILVKVKKKHSTQVTYVRKVLPHFNAAKTRRSRLQPRVHPRVGPLMPLNILQASAYCPGSSSLRYRCCAADEASPSQTTQICTTERKSFEKRRYRRKRYRAYSCYSKRTELTRSNLVELAPRRILMCATL